MSEDKQLLEDPTNRVVAVFEDRDKAEAARAELLRSGLTEGHIRILEGRGDASDVDTSDKWFADTREDLERYERELRIGNIVIAAPITDADHREAVHDILKRHEARLVTHFGRWVTEVMQ